MEHGQNTVTLTTAEVAALLRCSDRKVWTEARKHGIGAFLGGRAGWRFTHADVDALRAALTPRPAPKRRRGRAA